MRRTFLQILFVLVTAGLVYAAYDGFQTRDRAVTAGTGELLFPQLKARLNDTARVRAVTADGPLTLEHGESGWLVVERDGYPADQGKVQQLLIGLAELRRQEPKTARPERYDRLGLEDPGSEGAGSQSFRIEDASGNVNASVIVGNSRPARGQPDASEIYVRLPDDPQAWMAVGSLPRTADVIDWLDDELLDMDARRVRSVTVERADGDGFTVQRAPGEFQGYRLLDVPEGREVENHYVVRNVATGIMNLVLDDVSRATEAPPAADVEITVRAHDGLQVHMLGVKAGEDMHHLRLRASYAAQEAEHSAPPGETAGTGDDEILRLDADAVQAEVARLNGRWDGWVYTVGNWRIATANKTMGEFLKDPGDDSEAAPAQAGAPAPAAGASD